MEFNREILANYMKISKKDEGYIYRLYKTYNNISKLTILLILITFLYFFLL